MIGAGPYRCVTCSSYEEEDLWLRLDEALLYALRDVPQAYAIAWGVWADSRNYSEVRSAACDLMSLLVPISGAEY